MSQRRVRMLEIFRCWDSVSVKIWVSWRLFIQFVEDMIA